MFLKVNLADKIPVVSHLKEEKINAATIHFEFNNKKTLGTIALNPHQLHVEA